MPSWVINDVETKYEINVRKSRDNIGDKTENEDLKKTHKHNTENHKDKQEEPHPRASSGFNQTHTVKSGKSLNVISRIQIFFNTAKQVRLLLRFT